MNNDQNSYNTNQTNFNQGLNNAIQTNSNIEQIETLDVLNNNQQANNNNVHMEPANIIEQNQISQEQNISMNTNVQNIIENQNLSITNETKSKSSKKMILPIVITILLILGIVSFVLFKDKLRGNKIYNQGLSGTEYEIAKILFKDYLDDDFNEKNISVADYDNERKLFRCKYIVKEHTDLYQDTISFSTKNFITYTLNSTTYEKTESMWRPNNYTLGTFEGFSNDIKNQVLDKAKGSGYYTEENLSDNDYDKILSIVLNNDTNNIKQLIDNNNYELKNSTLSTGKKVIFLYEDKSNSENYIEISSAYNNVKKWEVYSSSDKALTTDEKYNSRYSSTVEKYIIDYDINIETDIIEIENIYSKINKN